MTGKTFSVDLPWPDPRLSPNKRLHWRALAAVKAAARQEAFLLCRKMGARPLTGPLDVTMTFYPPDRRRRDDDNIISSMKAFRDGIAEAVRVDDAEWRVTYRFAEEPQKPGRVEVRLEERAGVAATTTRP